MAAEAQRATSSRGSTSLVPRPRAGNALSSMAAAAAALIDRQSADPLPALHIFEAIPPGCDVVPIRCHVAVFQRQEIGSDDLIEGGIYVYEHQRPVACSPLPDSRRICTRKVVRIYRDSRGSSGNAWATRDLDQPLRPGDGPYYDWGLANMLIGRVVGVYQPGAE